MDRRTLTTLATVAAVAVWATLFGAGPSPAPEDPEPRSPSEAVAWRAADDLVERGEYLVTIGGCDDCHTPLKAGPTGPIRDTARKLSGHPEDLEMPPPPELPPGPWGWVGAATNTAFAGPWGVTYASNLTPHEETGTGRWTAEKFVEVIRTGRHPREDRPMLPPMPWPQYAQMTDRDLRAVFAYLQTLDPVDNRVPTHRPPAGPAAKRR